jgi:hypothetical protein
MEDIDNNSDDQDLNDSNHTEAIFEPKLRVSK